MSRESMITKVGEPSTDWPFLPYPVALERGVITPRPSQFGNSVTPPGVDIANGRIPNVHGGGVFSSGERTYAFDHASIVEGDSREIVISPSSKADVNHTFHSVFGKIVFSLLNSTFYIEHGDDRFFCF